MRLIRGWEAQYAPGVTGKLRLSRPRLPGDARSGQGDKREGSLPELSSDDPTQWVVRADPSDSAEPLHVAGARLVGYRCPEQADGDGFRSLQCQPSSPFWRV